MRSATQTPEQCQRCHREATRLNGHHERVPDTLRRCTYCQQKVCPSCWYGAMHSCRTCWPTSIMRFYRQRGGR